MSTSLENGAEIINGVGVQQVGHNKYARGMPRSITFEKTRVKVQAPVRSTLDRHKVVTSLLT